MRVSGGLRRGRFRQLALGLGSRTVRIGHRVSLLLLLTCQGVVGTRLCDRRTRRLVRVVQSCARAAAATRRPALFGTARGPRVISRVPAAGRLSLLPVRARALVVAAFSAARAEPHGTLVGEWSGGVE